jgi:beta-N-acetylhexosaminidase
VPTHINTYGSSETTLTGLIDKLTGRSPFKGQSPVDAFCGLWDTHL